MIIFSPVTMQGRRFIVKSEDVERNSKKSLRNLANKVQIVKQNLKPATTFKFQASNVNARYKHQHILTLKLMNMKLGKTYKLLDH